MTGAALLLAAAAAMPPPASTATAAPLVFPRVDVVVIYGVEGRPDIRQTLTVNAATGQERLDAPGGALAIVTDTRQGTELVIDERAGTFVRERTSRPPGAAGLAPPGVFTAVGRATVAGRSCTVYASRGPGGDTVTSCFTADGILLRTAEAGRPALVALAVREGPVSPALFLPPPGAREVPPPTPSPVGGG